MSNVRKILISNPEKRFVIKNLQEFTRIDGRAFDEYRNIDIQFGKDWGCCYVSIGKTKVVAQVTCELQLPKSSRPSEGILNINLELNPMADPSFEAGRQSDLSSQLNGLLEKCIIHSKAVDLESLCVKMNERVWSFRVDINSLNHEGNILDCASIAALAALAHFRRPDVTCDGMEFKIHSYKERDPIPTVIHHYPVCISYAIYSNGDFMVVDPNLIEEGVAEAFLSVGLNSYKELCGLHLGGKAQLATTTIMEATNKAAKRAGEIVEMIKIAVEKDAIEKLAMHDTGFHRLDLADLAPTLPELSVCLDHWSKSKKKRKHKKDSIEADSIKALGNNTAELVPHDKWTVEDDEDINNDEEVVYIKPSVDTINIDSASEEEETTILSAPQLKKSPKKK